MSTQNLIRISIMNPSDFHPAFASLSSFTPNTRFSAQHATTSSRHTATTMVAPKHVRRSEEIKRLTKQLEQLRAVRDELKKQTSESTPVTKPAEPSLEKPSPPAEQPPTASEPSSVKLGKHSEGSRFLSITDLPPDEYLPRILPVPGTVPGLTVAQLEATPRLMHSKNPELGMVYVTSVPEEYRGDLIAVPLPENITELIDPVVLRVRPAELSVSQLPCAEDDFVYLILERGADDSHFDNTKFYAWDIDGMVKIGWVKNKPQEQDARCLGRVLLGTLEVRKELRKKKSCWEEENESYV